MRCICYIVLSSRCSRHKTFYCSSKSTHGLSRKILYHRHHMGCIEKYHNHRSEQLYHRRSRHTRHPCIHDNVSSSLSGIHDTTFHHSPNNFSEIRAYLYKKNPSNLCTVSFLRIQNNIAFDNNCNGGAGSSRSHPPHSSPQIRSHDNSTRDIHGRQHLEDNCSLGRSR